MEKKYTVVYVESVGYNTGQTITKYRHVVTNDINKTVKEMEAWNCDVCFIFEGFCVEPKSEVIDGVEKPEVIDGVEKPEVIDGVEKPEVEFNEYNDPDATACANGDYNTFEENQCFGEE